MNLGFLLRTWLQQQAQATLRERVAQELNARDRSPEEPSTAHARPKRCDVAILFALAMESGGMEDLLSAVITTRAEEMTVREGALHQRSVVIALTGMGCEKAARAARAVIAGHRPNVVISAGFAGGLRDDLKRGDILMVEEIVRPGARAQPVDWRVDRSELLATPKLHLGRLVTVDEIAAKPAQKRALGQEHDAVAVDMESWAVAEICRQDKVPFLAVRAISDAVDDELPADVARLAAHTSAAGILGAATGAIFRRPSSVKDMLRLKQDALVASDRLARFLSGLVEQLPGATTA